VEERIVRKSRCSASVGLFVLGEDCCCVNDSSKRERKGKDREDVGVVFC
jgi:hypothetical protein